jgi:hypothetical protein
LNVVKIGIIVYCNETEQKVEYLLRLTHMSRTMLDLAFVLLVQHGADKSQGLVIVPDHQPKVKVRLRQLPTCQSFKWQTRSLLLQGAPYS